MTSPATKNPRAVLNWAGGIIGVALIGLLGFALYALIYVAVPTDNQNALTLLIGILSANVGMVVGFYFGSSATTKTQADTIDKQASTLQAAQAALAPVTHDATITLPAGESATVRVEPSQEPPP